MNNLYLSRCLFKVCEVDDVLDCVRSLHCHGNLHRFLLCLVVNSLLYTLMVLSI